MDNLRSDNPENYHLNQLSSNSHTTIDPVVSPLEELQETPFQRESDSSVENEDSLLHQPDYHTGQYATPSTSRATSVRAYLPQPAADTASVSVLNDNDKLHKSVDKIVSWWWWWEIIATIFSSACMCAIVVLLAKIDNLPLQSWWLSIQPNSVVAILTTVGKAALMVPAAACISQLKWRHFLLRPRRLIDLEVFDEASRGPWGSAVLLSRFCLHPRGFVAIGFAVVTIVALGIDATAQQVLDFPLGETSLDNTTIEVGIANKYFSKGILERPGYSQIWEPNVDLLKIQAAIINGVSATPSQPNFKCPEPAAQCQWDSFTTLGVCTDFKNITELVKPVCTSNSTFTGMNCTYTSPDPPYGDGLPVSIAMHWDPENNGQGRAMLFQSAWNRTGFYTNSMPASLGTFMTIKAFGNGATEITDDGAEVPPAADIGLGTMTWCVQTFHNVSASPSNINAGYMTSERIGSQLLIPPGTDTTVMNATYRTYQLNSTGALYNMSRMTIDSLPQYLNYIFTSTIFHDADRDDSRYGDTLQPGYTYYKGDTAAMFHNVGETISNQIRGGSPGDNYNAETVKGTATFMETYIKVRWPWMILPLTETVLTAVLLVISIVVSHDQPLLKTSVTAYLVSRLDGWADGELDTKGRPRLMQEHLEKLAEEVEAKLESVSEGKLTFRNMKVSSV